MIPNIFKLTDLWTFGAKPKILFVSPEAAPFARAGGLGEVMNSLPTALKKIGCDARVMLPKYASIDAEKYQFSKEAENMNLFPKDPKGLFVCNVLKYENKEEERPITYFLENQEFYEKSANIYGYGDDPVSWL